MRGFWLPSNPQSQVAVVCACGCSVDDGIKPQKMPIFRIPRTEVVVYDQARFPLLVANV